ncbi:4526_t:CDS:2 [Scutellospora calospora]|uniref:4526_t:CDS:1 n=1 Tax=Scutellospora calospora TaxID=85575 RepID=A0ACA9K198_9GLOM|nr:4526_t:CDS:2 [Scutellospora calospora]
MQKLKRNAEYQFKCRSKKTKAIVERQEVVRYDKKHINDSVEYGSADAHRHKEAIKVRIVSHQRENLEKNYGIYMAKTTLNNYLLPRHSNSVAAKAHYHLTWIAVARVSCDETKYHPDGHYCLASVKGARQLAQTFAEFSVIISQDNKAKISLVQIPDYDFVHGSNQKLIPLVYLIIKLSEANDDLWTRQVAIFVRPQWSIGTLSITHMEDLTCLVLDNQYSEALKMNSDIKPIWILLVNGGPDENPRHLKNIESYCKIFKKFDLDYLSVRMYTLGQSKYNPVERSIAIFSSKLAGVVLPIDHFGKHLDSQSRVINNELANKNFHYASSMLINIKRCTDLSCCGPIKAQEAMDFLQPFNGFFPLITKARDGHYLNPVHLLQYSECFKVPKYDTYCLSIDQTTYSRLCCSICHKYFPTLSYVAKHKRLQHSSTHGRSKKKPEISESIAEFVLITNSATMEDLNLLFLQQNENEFFNECRECFSDIE